MRSVSFSDKSEEENSSIDSNYREQKINSNNNSNNILADFAKSIKSSLNFFKRATSKSSYSYQVNRYNNSNSSFSWGSGSGNSSTSSTSSQNGKDASSLGSIMITSSESQLSS